MKAIIEVNMDNAAFGWDAPEELARILRDIAGQVEAGLDHDIQLWDINGNKVGQLVIEE